MDSWAGCSSQPRAPGCVPAPGGARLPAGLVRCRCPARCRPWRPDAACPRRRSPLVAGSSAPVTATHSPSTAPGETATRPPCRRHRRHKRRCPWRRAGPQQPGPRLGQGFEQQAGIDELVGEQGVVRLANSALSLTVPVAVDLVVDGEQLAGSQSVSARGQGIDRIASSARHHGSRHLPSGTAKTTEIGWVWAIITRPLVSEA